MNQLHQRHFQFMLSLNPVGQGPIHQSVKFGPMIAMDKMAEFMNHDVFNALPRRFYQFRIERKHAVFLTGFPIVFSSFVFSCPAWQRRGV